MLRRTIRDDSNLMCVTVEIRSDEEIGKETKTPKIRCLNLCNVDVRDIEVKLVENDQTFVVTSNQHPRERRRASKTHAMLTEIIMDIFWRAN